MSNNKKIVTVSNGSKMSVNQFINSFSPNYLRELSGNEKKHISGLKTNESYFLGVDSYLCKVTRVK